MFVFGESIVEGDALRQAEAEQAQLQSIAMSVTLVVGLRSSLQRVVDQELSQLSTWK